MVRPYVNRRVKRTQENGQSVVYPKEKAKNAYMPFFSFLNK